MMLRDYKGFRGTYFGFRISDFGTSTPHSLPSEAEPLRRTGAIPACPAGRRNPQSGISLIEVIMVMVIIAILAAVVIPRAGFDISPRASVEGGAYMIDSDIRYVQECAMANRVSKSIAFVSGQSTYTFPATVPSTSNLDPSGRLPSGVTIGTTITITFNSLGEPTTGAASVTVSGGGQTKTISVVNYTGKVSIS
jgi:prepilin-type N-terminal cleavage/methylation domain-containing protein